MRRDMELIREILIAVVESEDGIDPQMFVSDTRPWPHVFHQVKTLDQAGYIEGYISNYKSGDQRAFIRELTWAGDEFYAAIQDKTIWANTEKEIGKSFTAATFDIIKAVALKMMMGVLGL